MPNGAGGAGGRAEKSQPGWGSFLAAEKKFDRPEQLPSRLQNCPTKDYEIHTCVMLLKHHLWSRYTRCGPYTAKSLDWVGCSGNPDNITLGRPAPIPALLKAQDEPLQWLVPRLSLWQCAKTEKCTSFWSNRKKAGFPFQLSSPKDKSPLPKLTSITLLVVILNGASFAWFHKLYPEIISILLCEQVWFFLHIVKAVRRTAACCSCPSFYLFISLPQRFSMYWQRSMFCFAINGGVAVGIFIHCTDFFLCVQCSHSHFWFPV